MTIQELEEYLVQEKKKAEKSLGCDMCKKYARCLYCYSRDEYPCAKAHERLLSAMNRNGRTIPSYLLPEPPIEEVKPPVRITARPASRSFTLQSVLEEEDEIEERDDGRVETIAHILSDYNMDSMSDERAREYRKISAMMDSTDEAPAADRLLFRSSNTEKGVPLLVLTRKTPEEPAQPPVKESRFFRNKRR